MPRVENGVNMDEEKRTQKIHNLDMKHHDADHQTNLLVRDEEARRLKLQIVLLKDEISTLQDRSGEKDTQIDWLTAQYDDLAARLDSASEKCRSQESRLRVQAREQANLKTELLSLNGVTQDSAKLLSEKLTLSRELALLKPEVEHLRSQLAHQKEVLAEKLALERQLNALEVELANEKRAVQRAQARQERLDLETEDELREQLQDLEKKLAHEKRAAHRAKQTQGEDGTVEDELRDRVAQLEQQLAAEKKRPAQRAKKGQAAAHDTETESALRKIVQTLEMDLDLEKSKREKAQKESEQELQLQMALTLEKLGDLRMKLKEARTELKTARAELMTAGQGPVTAKAEEKMPKQALAKPQARRKRRAKEIDEEPEPPMQTPSQVDVRPKRPLKKRLFESTLGGEKSAFSITPFLNKTINFADHSVEFTAGGAATRLFGQEKTQAVSVLDVDGGDSMAMDLPASIAPSAATAQPSQTTTTKVPLKAAAKPRGRPSKTKVLGEISASKNNLKASARKPAISEPTLDRVMEEVEVDNMSTEQENHSSETTTTSLLKSKASTLTLKLSDTTTTSSLEPEPKKKKRKLLGGGPKTLFGDDDEVGAAATAPTKRKALGSRSLAKGLSGLKRSAFGGGGFSPLKREKRGVNASFLA